MEEIFQEFDFVLKEKIQKKRQRTMDIMSNKKRNTLRLTAEEKKQSEYDKP